VGSAAPETDPAGRLDRRGRDAAGHRRHPDAPHRRTAASRRPSETSAALDVGPGLSGDELDGIWTAWLRRFDLEHTFRFLKQTLGWTTPRPRTPAQADTWTWMVIAAVTPLGLARTLVADLRLPWEAPAEPGKLTPARVRRGFQNLRPDLGCPARAPKPSRPGPGRPKGRRNTRRAPVYDPGKTTKRSQSLAQQSAEPKIAEPPAG
jgi:hypothetical protein